MWDAIISVGQMLRLQVAYYCCLNRPKGHIDINIPPFRGETL